MTDTLRHTDSVLVVQRYRVRCSGRTRRALFGAAASAMAIGVVVNLVDTHPSADGTVSGWCLLLALVLAGVAATRRTSYSVTVSVAGVRYQGGLGVRWFPWERVDHFATHWQEVEDHSRRRVLVVLRDAVPQPLNLGWSRRPMTAAEVDRVAHWLNEWVAYRRDPVSQPVPRLPEGRR